MDKAGQAGLWAPDPDTGGRRHMSVQAGLSGLAHLVPHPFRTDHWSKLEIAARIGQKCPHPRPLSPKVSPSLRIRHIFRPNSAAIRPILKGWGTK
jgi:hypothetical protein